MGTYCNITPIMLCMVPRDPTPPPGQYRKLEPHEWIKQVREDKKINQSTIEERTIKFDPRARISQSYISKIEKGLTPLASLGPLRLEALRQALGVTTDDWVTNTGLIIVTQAERDDQPELPNSLQEASIKYGDSIPDLRNSEWLQLLRSVSPHNWDGPETPEEWLALYMNLRNHTKPRKR